MIMILILSVELLFLKGWEGNAGAGVREWLWWHYSNQVMARNQVISYLKEKGDEQLASQLI